MERTKTYDRYARQIILNDFGENAQSKLKSAHVLVIGAGGLGCPLLQYLVSAGIGEITLVDDDRIALHNLHRQILFDETNIGELKVDVAKQKLSKMNNDVSINARPSRFTTKLAAELIPAVDLVIDTSDNFATRYLVNDACVIFKKTLVFGAVSKYEGQVAVFNKQLDNSGYSTNYRDLFPSPPSDDEILNCEEAGVIGALPGVIGSMQSLEAIKLITGIGQPLVNKLLTYNVLKQEFYTIELVSSAKSDSAPVDLKEFLSFDYPYYCQSKKDAHNEIDASQWLAMTDAWIIDVRELHETPRLNELIGNTYLEIPLSQLHGAIGSLQDKKIVFICQSGKRSLKAKAILQSNGYSTEVYSARGGIDALIKQKQ